MSDNPDPTAKLSLAGLLALVRRGTVEGLRVSLPGRVESYDKATQRAEVLPLVGDGYTDEDDTRQYQDHPVISDVPVAFPGAGEYAETFPISKGDTVLLVFCSSSIARWKKLGGTGDPKDDRRHALPDAIAYAGVRDDKHPIAGVPGDAWMIKVPNGKKILLGGPDADDSVMRKSDGQAFMTALASAITALSAAPVPAAALTALQTALQAAILPSGLPWVTGMDSPVKVR